MRGDTRWGTKGADEEDGLQDGDTGGGVEFSKADCGVIRNNLRIHSYWLDTHLGRSMRRQRVSPFKDIASETIAHLHYKLADQVPFREQCAGALMILWRSKLAS